MSRDRRDRPGRGPRLVYSTGPGGAEAPPDCPRCARTPCACSPGPAGAPEPADHPRLEVRRERAGRRGKVVTTVETVLGPRQAVAELLRLLKKRLGAGGTLVPAPGEAAGFTLELQGDRVERVTGELERLGYRTRRAGG